MTPSLAHGFSGPAGGVSSLLYFVAAGAAFIFLEARDRRRTAEQPRSLDRRVRVSGMLCLLALVLGATAMWWVPGARKHDKTRKPAAATATLRYQRGLDQEITVGSGDRGREVHVQYWTAPSLPW